MSHRSRLTLTALTLVAAGAHGLAVSSLEEGLELRQGGITSPVLVLGGLRPEALPAASSEGLSIAVVGPEHLAEYARILPDHPVRLHLPPRTSS